MNGQRVPQVIEKGQVVRLVDVFAMGPLMVWVADTCHTLPRWARLSLTVMGQLTIAYNAENYLKVRQANAASTD